MKKRVICAITANRAEYSRQKSVFEAINKNTNLDLKLIVTGSHLLQRYGNTISNIKDDGFDIYSTCDISLEGASTSTMTKSIGLAIMEFTNILNILKPDVLLVMGDRYEAMAAAISGASLNICVAHIQGGEVTGSIDESFRHAITKLSHLHFPSTQLSKENIIKLGENPSFVFNVGCPSIDIISKVDILEKKKLLSLPELQRDKYSFNHNQRYILAFYHPVTSIWEDSYTDMTIFLTALKELNIQTIFLYPNSDAGSEEIIKSIRHFFLNNDVKNIEFYKHFNIESYTSILANASCIVGNSSSGIREACYFGTPTVNIGKRQQYRERTQNILDIEMDKDIITKSIKLQLNKKYIQDSRYGSGESGIKISDILSTIDLPNIQKVIHYVKE